MCKYLTQENILCVDGHEKKEKPNSRGGVFVLMCLIIADIPPLFIQWMFWFESGWEERFYRHGRRVEVKRIIGAFVLPFHGTCLGNSFIAFPRRSISDSIRSQECYTVVVLIAKEDFWLVGGVKNQSNQSSSASIKALSKIKVTIAKEKQIKLPEIAVLIMD